MIWEDSILERKVESDLKDILKTLVGFANSVKPGHKAELRIGEKDDGTIIGVTNPDSIQKMVRKECDKIYPAILYTQSVYENDGKYCVKVEVEYSGDTPHFGGEAWIRRGSETIKANDEIFQSLIDIRSGIVMELTKWMEKEVTVQGSQSFPIHSVPWLTGQQTVRIVFINKFWITFQLSNSANASVPLKKLTLSYDDIQYRLKIFIEN